MRRFVLIFALLISPLHISAEPVSTDTGRMIEAFRPLPFRDLSQRVTKRYKGRIIAAEIRPPQAKERDLGAALVYEFRLLSPDRHLLNIRLDARTGKFLEVAGRGQIAARK